MPRPYGDRKRNAVRSASSGAITTSFDHAPHADGVDHEQLQHEQVHAEEQPDERDRRGREARRRAVPRHESEHDAVGDETERCDRNSGDLRVLGLLHGLATATRDAYESGIVEVHPRQVAGDTDPGERHDRGREAQRAVGHPSSASSRAARS